MHNVARKAVLSAITPAAQNTASSKAIGGYFELELPVSTFPLHHSAIRFQSARAAFHALLSVGQPQRVWMPKYICDAMLAPLHALDVEIVFYDLDPGLGVDEDVVLEPQDWLLYVNYFGLCSDQEERLLRRFKPSQLIMDHSQAFFATPKDCLATIYSPRKFFGLPDGGLLHTTLKVSEPTEIDSGSVARCSHLLQRLDTSAEAGYADFKLAEETLRDTQPRRMSTLSTRLFSSIDLNRIKQRRNANFVYLHQRLKHLNGLDLDVVRIGGPLCYPLLMEYGNVQALREALAAERVFIPSYWPEVRTRVADDALERQLVDGCLPIPCDQRYERADLELVCDLLLRQMKRVF
ncbi:hypothetical protein [Paraherbaspirillum soli]|uniref:DegT/DnrJ/EryC1/StrS aminotransferase family protein n=1 Tax=Paraherbaspirillum soli TaxID=631222 RepID=A0ABW0MDT0_9BURK